MRVRNWSALVRVRFAWPAEERPGVVDILAWLAEAAGAVAAYDASPGDGDGVEVLECVPLGEPYDDRSGEEVTFGALMAAVKAARP